MTPSEALEWRDAALKWLTRHPAEVAQRAVTQLVPIRAAMRIVSDLRIILTQARLVIWKGDLWAAAMQGHAEAFESTPSGETDDYPPQLWLMGFPMTFGLTEAQREELELSPTAWVLGMLIYPGVLFDQPQAAPGLGQTWLCLDSGDMSGMPILRSFGMQEANAPIYADYLHVFAGLRFLDQPFIAQDPHHFPRPMRRAAELKRRPPLPEVNVVQLRRTERLDATDPDHQAREYSCSWLVSGHWRRPSPQMKEQRPVYVRPHAKGDPEKPLRAPKGTVYVVNR